MTIPDWLSVLIVLIGLLLSFFFSGSETALTASSRATMGRLAKEGNRKAAIVNALMARRERMIGALLFGNNAANIAASTLAAGLFLAWFGDVGVIYATVVMTVVVVVFCEVLPKSAALGSPDRFSLAVAPAIQRVVRLLDPVLAGTEWLVRRILAAMGFRVGENAALLSPHDELRGAVDMMHRDGSVEKYDRDMLGGLLDLRDLVVSDVMIHRTEMITLSADGTPQEIVTAALAAPRTRIPLWRDSPENIIGILHAKDLLREIQAQSGDLSKVDVAAIARPAWFVPEVRPLSEQLKAFRRRKTPFALVVDEYGEVMGLVTLTDILTEIVGEMSDEHDAVVKGVQPHPDGSVDVDGAVPIRDLNRAMDWNLPDDEATTIAGLVIHEARSIPDPGQTFTFHGFRFRVQRKHRNRITALQITPLTRKTVAAKAG
jgi:Mg2+/Co2+ transporter CorB